MRRKGLGTRLPTITCSPLPSSHVHMFTPSHPHTITCSHPPTLTPSHVHTLPPSQWWGPPKAAISLPSSQTTHTLTSSHPHSGRVLHGLQYLCLAEEHIASTSPPQHTTHILPPSHPHTITPSQWWGPPGAAVSLPGGGTHCLDKPPTTHYSHPPTLPPSHPHSGGVLQGLQYLCLAEEHIASTSPPQHTTHILPPSHHHTLTPSQWWGPPWAAVSLPGGGTHCLDKPSTTHYSHPPTLPPSHPHTLTVVGSSMGCSISAWRRNTLPRQALHNTLLTPSHPPTLTPSQWWGPPGAAVSLPGGGTHCLDKPSTTHYSHPHILPPSHPHSGRVLHGLQYLCLAEEHIASTRPPQHPLKHRHPLSRDDPCHKGQSGLGGACHRGRSLTISVRFQ